MSNTDPDALVPVAWMDDFGNAFPLGAVKGAASWIDEHQRNWKPLYSPDTIERLTRERDEAVVVANAAQRLLPILERATKDLVFTADRAGEVSADMSTIRAAIRTTKAPT